MQRILFILSFCLWAASASAATLWNEAVSGDLSGNHLAPTPVTFNSGTNTIMGSMGDAPADGIPLDRDIFTFTIAPGFQLNAIDVINYSPRSQPFYAIAPGTSISITNSSGHLANTLVTGLNDLLFQMAGGSFSGGTGISSPLGPGTYTAWFQEVSAVVTYQMDYQVAAVPEPSHGMLLLSGIGGLLIRRSRRMTVG
ncbi:PEP-CTERM sorting domain-containing protein [Prosthecobacter sp.]